jgi:hypothetical protein
VLGLGCWFFLIKGVVRFLTYDAFGANVKLYMQNFLSDWSRPMPTRADATFSWV